MIGLVPRVFSLTSEPLTAVSHQLATAKSKKSNGAEEGILSAHFSQVTVKPALAR